MSITPPYRQTPGVNTDKNYTAEKPIQFWTVPTHHLFILANKNFKIKAIINHCNAYFSRCIIFALKISKLQRPMPSVNIFTKKHASYIQRASIQWIHLANEWKFRDSRAATYGFNLPTRLTLFGSGFRTGVRNRATGPGYGTNIWDNDADTGAIQSGGTRAWITLTSTGIGHGNGQRKRVTSTGKSS